MNERTQAAAQLLAQKLELDLPPELIAVALSQLSRKPATAPSEAAAVREAPPDTGSVGDSRPLAGIVGGPSTSGDLADLLPRLLQQLGSSGSGPERRAELAAAASMLGALLGGSGKRPS